MKENIILGLDPGSVTMGFGIIQLLQPLGKTKLITYGTLSLKKFKDPMLRMHYIYIHMMELLQKYKPHSVAIESIFQGKNIQSALKLGRAQGVAIATTLACNIPLTEYTPNKIKKAITGQGHASKKQVAAMVGQLLGISTTTNVDGSDALAIALCHSQQQLACIKKTKNWKEFLTTYPHRLASPHPFKQQN